ncbi:beta-agarase [bacterium]|nr:beta-agarase [bacterium]
MRTAQMTILLLLASLASAGEQVLFDFEGGFAVGKVEARDIKATHVRGSALRLESGHKDAWPGITLVAPKGVWDLSAFDHVALDVRNVGANAVTVNCRVDNAGADGARNCNTGNVALKPGGKGTLKVAFRRKVANDFRSKLFGMRGYPGGGGAEPSIDPAKVNQLLIFVGKPTEDHAFEIDNVRAAGTYTPPTVPVGKPFFPFIDAFGQYIHKDWPGKTHSVEDMATRLAEETKDLAAHAGPKDWNKWGGWETGPPMKATGRFYPAKHKGKWWLVDPDGKLFWSHGIDCVRASDSTPIDDREAWFQDFPGDQPEFKNCWSRRGNAVRDYYKDKKPRCFSFTRANVMRKYGAQWQTRIGEMAHERLRSWGMNTIANWSEPGIYLMEPRKTAYCVAVHFGGKPLEGSKGYWGKFRDVFDPSFRQALRQRMAQEKGKTADDPWCMGYFVDNEIAWGDQVSLAVAALTSPPSQKAKQVFVADLKAKYGAIAKLNAAWGAKHASWQALLDWRTAPNKKRAWDDLTAFYTKTAETYFKACRESVKEVAPQGLYLGCRFAWVNKRAVAAAVKYCDVVSYNQYKMSVAGFRLPVEADVPVIIGEFHFGALDRGMFHTGLRAVKDQAARGAAYRSYVEAAVRHPQLVGTGWFKYMDEPTTGRALDGENYQIGFLDSCDTPYPETIAASRDVGYRIYALRSQ